MEDEEELEEDIRTQGLEGVIPVKGTGAGGTCISLSLSQNFSYRHTLHY